MDAPFCLFRFSFKGTSMIVDGDPWPVVGAEGS